MYKVPVKELEKVKGKTETLFLYVDWDTTEKNKTKVFPKIFTTVYSLKAKKNLPFYMSFEIEKEVADQYYFDVVVLNNFNNNYWYEFLKPYKIKFISEYLKKNSLPRVKKFIL